MEIQKNVELKNYTTYKIGGVAKYFCVVKNTDDLQKALQFAKEKELKFFVLGGGSNLLVDDKGYGGLVIKLQVCKVHKVEKKDNEIFAGAGTLFADVVKLALENCLSGTEWALGIPRMTVGGAVFGNAQAFGIKISQIIKEVQVFDVKTKKIKNLSNKQCKFSLKTSAFKKNKNLIILSAVFALEKENKEQIKENIKKFLDYRKNNHPMNLPSAGSVFVNSEKKITNKKLLENFPELKYFNNKGAIPSGYLIEKCGLVGKKIGGAQISTKHANFIVNVGNAKSADVIKLMNLAKSKVYQKFGIKLETEIQILK